MRPSKVETMLEIATVVAKRSTCSRLQVGAVLTDLRMEQMWVGYNGVAKGSQNECYYPDFPGRCGCLHAEINAVIKAPGDIDKMAFLTSSPCPACAVALVNAHVLEVHYIEEYREPIQGKRILAEAGIRQNGEMHSPEYYGLCL